MADVIVEIGEPGVVAGLFQGTDELGVGHTIRTDKVGRVKQSNGQPDPTVSGLLTLLNQQAALNMDGFSSFTVQFTGTYTGANVTMEQSLDSTNGTDGTWIPIQVNRPDSIGSITASPLSNSSTGALIFQGQAPGATWVRARLTSNTATGTGILVKLVASTSAASAIQGVAGALTPSIEPYSSYRAETGTNLAANATYTGTGRDTGSDASRGFTRVRAFVRHIAGLTPGTLVIQQSADNATWTETYRAPVPSDSYGHGYEATLYYRYYRVLFVNGATAQTGMILQSQHVVAEGNSDTDHLIPFTLSTTLLAAGATFTGPALDLGSNHGWGEIRAIAHTDQASAAGGFYVQQSRDGATWRGTSVATIAAGVHAPLSSMIYMRYVRIILVNGTTAQTFLDLNCVLVPL